MGTGQLPCGGFNRQEPVSFDKSVCCGLVGSQGLADRCTGCRVYATHGPELIAMCSVVHRAHGPALTLGRSVVQPVWGAAVDPTCFCCVALLFSIQYSVFSIDRGVIGNVQQRTTSTAFPYKGLA